MLLAYLALLLPIVSDASIKRCFSCRSRGDLGSCKDKFVYFNASAGNHLDEAKTGIEAVPCASGWCGKVIETNDLKSEEYGLATQRMCLQRSPSDNEERCDNTVWTHKRVFMCFCKGDLCNSAFRPSLFSIPLITAAFLVPSIIFYLFNDVT